MVACRRFDRSSDPRNSKPFSLEQRADATGLVALDFYGALLRGAAAAARRLEPARQALNVSAANVRRKIADHNHSFAAAMGFLAPQYHAAKLRGFRHGRVGSILRRLGLDRSRRQSRALQRGKRIVEGRAGRGESELLLFGHDY